jgi:hypothetical protein
MTLIFIQRFPIEKVESNFFSDNKPYRTMYYLPFSHYALVAWARRRHPLDELPRKKHEKKDKA